MTNNVGDLAGDDDPPGGDGGGADPGAIQYLCIYIYI